MNLKVPKRVQRSRKKGSKLPPNTLCCTRPGPWSNPIVGKNADAAKWFRIWLVKHPRWIAGSLLSLARQNGASLRLHKSSCFYQTTHRYLDNLEQLRQYDHLGCWCRLEDDCHCDTYIELLTAGR